MQPLKQKYIFHNNPCATRHHLQLVNGPNFSCYAMDKYNNKRLVLNCEIEKEKTCIIHRTLLSLKDRWRMLDTVFFLLL